VALHTPRAGTPVCFEAAFTSPTNNADGFFKARQ